MESYNTSHQAHIELEKTWSTRLWGDSVFSFLLDMSEMNANLGERHFVGVEAGRPMLEFSIIISRGLINNSYLRQDYMISEKINIKINRHNDGHILIKIPIGGK